MRLILILFGCLPVIFQEDFQVSPPTFL